MNQNIQDIGLYTVEAEIGRGGMGVVYRATDTRLGRPVAMKALPKDFAGDAERLDRGPLAVDEALEVCAQISRGVEAAHEAGIIHRDLEPGNVKLTPDGKVKVLDFGPAKETLRLVENWDAGGS